MSRLHRNLPDRSIIYGPAAPPEEVGENAAQQEVKEHAVFTARLSSIPFAAAALGMVVSYSI